MLSAVLSSRAMRWLPVLALVLLSTPVAPGEAAVRTAGSLSVSTDRYYAGQRLVWSGTTGQTGRRRLTLQSHMGRSGDHWDAVEGFSATTRADGTFRFGYSGPAMGNISFRVVVGSVATPKVTFYPQHQEVLLRATADDPRAPSGAVVAGEPMTVTVDTGAGGIVLPGRLITLQRRTGVSGWTTVATGTAGADGRDRLTFTAPTEGSQAVYRARAENWTQDGDRVGWFPSFPTYVDVVRRPVAASSLGADRLTHERVALSWVVPLDASITKVAVVRAPGTKTPTWDGNSRARLDAGATRYADGVPAGRTYTYAVFTLNSRGVASPASEPVTIRTPDGPTDGRSAS